VLNIFFGVLRDLEKISNVVLCRGGDFFDFFVQQIFAPAITNSTPHVKRMPPYTKEREKKPNNPLEALDV
jgi:hypothetical protein